MEKIGLIAGNRKFPLLFAQAAKNKGYYVVAVAIKGDTSSRLTKLVDKIYWLNLSQFEDMVEIFKREGIGDIVMAGQISPRRLFSREVLDDPKLAGILTDIRDKKADTIFSAIAAELEANGLYLMNSTLFMEDYLPGKGTLSKAVPDNRLWEDVYFGLEVAKSVAALDIGQTVAVKSKVVIAVEAFEGTDRLIRRAGKITGGGITVVKVSKPKQDKRFDIPVVGLGTVKSLVRAKASCLAIEANKTLFIDKTESLALADRKGLSIVAV